MSAQAVGVVLLFALTLGCGAASRPAAAPSPATSAAAAEAEARAREGDLLWERGDGEGALGRWSAIVCPSQPPLFDPARIADCRPIVPPSAALTALWLQIGRVAFETSDGPRAIAALEAFLALAPDDDPQIATARYVLGWAFYRADRYAEALQAFAKAATFASSEVREEAVTYLGILVAEPDWDGDGADDALRGLGRPEVRALFDDERALAADVMWSAANTLADMARYVDAIALYRELVARFPDDPRVADANARAEVARTRMLGPSVP